MCASIIQICTDNPKQQISQKDGKQLALRRFDATENPGCRQSLIASIYENSRIDKRHVSFLPEIPPEEELKLETRLTNAVEVINPLVTNAARKAIINSGISKSDIGVIVPVSSTVLQEPGVSANLVNALGLPQYTERTPVSFAGCAAGVAGLRVAEDYVRAHPDRAALLVAFEVPSAHGRGVVRSVSGEVIHSLFADGCAAAIIVAANSPFERDVISREKPVIRIHGRRSELVPGTETGITLSASSAAIDCLLSKDLSKYLVKAVNGYVERLIQDVGLTWDDMSYWAVHPGGRKIIESVENGCRLPDSDLAESYQVLREHGNMLSVSIFFVLNLLIERHSKGKETAIDGVGERFGAGFSFAPGVSVEGFVFSVYCEI